MLDISQSVVKGSSGAIMAGFQIVDAITSGVPLKTVISPGASYTAKFPTVGNLAYRIVLDTDLTLTFDNESSNQFQKLIIMLQQPVNGDCIATLPNIQWLNKTLYVDSRISSLTVFEVLKFNNILLGNFIGSITNG